MPRWTEQQRTDIAHPTKAHGLQMRINDRQPHGDPTGRANILITLGQNIGQRGVGRLALRTGQRRLRCFMGKLAMAQTIDQTEIKFPFPFPPGA